MKGTRSKLLLSLFFTYLISQIIVRILLFLHPATAASYNTSDLSMTFLLGLFFDSVAAIQALLPLFLLLLFMPAAWMRKNFFKKILTVILFGIYSLLIFIAISEYLFWDEFQNSFNFIAVDYLIYTTEVFGNIQESYNLWLIIPSLLLSAGIMTYLQNKFLPYDFTELNLKQKFAGLIMAILLPVLFFNTVDSNWRNYAGDNKYNFEIAGNGPYEFMAAFRNNELDYDKFYITQNNDKIIADLRTLMKTPDSSFVDNSTITRRIENHKPLKTPNIVMIVVESLSADFMGRFGSMYNLTPNLDDLSKKSLFFTNLYATGTRTVRGLEALSVCVPPTPGQSILRRPENDDLFLFGSVLKKQGYTNSFIYGGYGYFDNMNTFYLDNGYNVIDRTDIPKNEVFFETIWGVADEIIFDQSIKELDKNTAKKQKTFQLVVTTSNHRPFTYPENRIDMPDGTRLGAVKYTDWAIGDFIEKAKKKDWFNDTLFIIIADHQANSAGKVTLPVSKYRIPCMIYAPGFIIPEENSRLMSQIDIPPTILGLLGFSYDSRFLGYDINTLEKGRERAFISTYQNLGYIKDDKLVILKPQRKSEFYTINNFQTSTYTQMPKDDTLLSEALAWYQGTSYLYKNRLLKNI